MLAHVDRADVPTNYQMIEIEIDDDVSTETPTLPANWRASVSRCRATGDAWLARSESLLLRVPSALAPKTTNVLMNPRHAQMTSVRIGSVETLDLDRRLTRE